MQASKSREDLSRFDIFGCMNCGTSIIETEAGAAKRQNDQEPKR
jgi:hypothetical protein